MIVLQKSNSLSAPLKWLAGSTLLLSMIVAAQGESPTPAASSCGTEQMLRLADHGTVNVDLSTYTASGANPRGVNGTLDTCQFEARNDNFLKSTASARDVFLVEPDLERLLSEK